MSVLICGSIAFDNIMEFHDKFENHILADHIDNINVSFFVPTMRREYGGCAGNIAYANKLLGANPIPMGTVGKDFEPYLDYLKKLNIDTSHIKTEKDHFTAQCFITTDEKNNQITAFHPGAMSVSHDNDIEQAIVNGISYGIVSPDGLEGMIKNANDLFEKKIPFIFDPGQAMPLFDEASLLDVIEKSSIVIANEYESKLIENITGKSISDLSNSLETFIVTKGSNGIDSYIKGKVTHIKSINVKAENDPTGCGDAFRGGLLYGLEQKMDIETCIKIGCVLGGYKIEVYGSQNYNFTLSEFQDRYYQNYDEKLNLV